MKKFKPKKVIRNQQYDNYWKLTVEYTNIYDKKFNNTLKIIILFIDEFNIETKDYSPKELKLLYKNLQTKIYNVYPKRDKASVRKSINQFVKLGFIKPYLKGYHRLSKLFLNSTDQYEKRTIFAKIFYEKASFSSAVTKDYTDKKEINFLLKTLAYNPNKNLAKEDIIALMVTPNISIINKGYLTIEELQEQFEFSKAIAFEEKKYNQINYLFTFLNYIPNIQSNKEDGVSFIDPDEVEIDTKRDPILYGLMKNNLKEESTKLYGKQVCDLKKINQKGLVCSHIKDSAVCLKEGNIDEAYDYNNSLLLAPDIDSYFDTYSISFNDKGEILINDFELIDSDYMSYLSTFSLDNKILTKERLYYLTWHRNEFRKKYKRDKESYNKFLEEND